MTSVDAVSERLAQVRKIAFVVGLVALVPSLIGVYFRPTLFYSAYLVVFLFFWMIALGSLAIALLHHLTGGGWGLPIRRPLEAAYGTLPLLAVMFIPVLLNLSTLYPWAQPDLVAGDVILQHKAAYLNVASFQLRAAFYFAAWILLGTWIAHVSAGRFQPDEVGRREHLAAYAGPGLIVWGLTVTFASIDWGMSLEPHWYSSVYGVLFMAGQAVSGLAFAIGAVVMLRSQPAIATVLDVSRLHDLGNFLLAFTMFWSYIHFTQFLVIWSGNLPEETPWYLSRGAGGWQFLAVLLIGLHFLTPFLLLLCRSTKRSSSRLMFVALLLLAMRLADLYWLVMPAFAPQAFVFNLLIPVALALIGGFWLASYLKILSFRLTLPVLELLTAEPEKHHERIEPARS